MTAVKPALPPLLPCSTDSAVSPAFHYTLLQTLNPVLSPNAPCVSLPGPDACRLVEELGYDSSAVSLSRLCAAQPGQYVFRAGDTQYTKLAQQHVTTATGAQVRVTAKSGWKEWPVGVADLPPG